MILSLLLACAPDDVASDAVGALSVPDAFVFAELLVDFTVREEVPLSVSGDGPVDIVDVQLDGASFELGEWPEQIDAGTDDALDVWFVPAEEGVATGLLTITSTSPDSPHTVTLEASGILPQADLSPEVIDFGRVTVGASVAELMYIVNNSDWDITIEDVTVKPPFSVWPGSVSATLPAGQRYPVQLDCSPEVAGTYTADVVVSIAGGEPALLPVSVTVEE